MISSAVIANSGSGAEVTGSVGLDVFPPEPVEPLLDPAAEDEPPEDDPPLDEDPPADALEPDAFEDAPEPEPVFAFPASAEPLLLFSDAAAVLSDASADDAIASEPAVLCADAAVVVSSVSAFCAATARGMSGSLRRCTLTAQITKSKRAQSSAIVFF